MTALFDLVDGEVIVHRDKPPPAEWKQQFDAILNDLKGQQ